MRIENAPYVKAVMGGNEYAIQNSPKNVAAAIYKANVTQQNISILTPDNVTIVSTFGPFLDRCTDLDYTNKKLIPELTAMQTLQRVWKIRPESFSRSALCAISLYLLS